MLSFKIEDDKSVTACWEQDDKTAKVTITPELYKDLKSICGYNVEELLIEIMKEEWNEHFGSGK